MIDKKAAELSSQQHHLKYEAALSSQPHHVWEHYFFMMQTFV